MANNGLREDRAAAVEAGLVHYQMVAAERDSLAKELANSKNEIASLKVVAEAQAAQLNEMLSRISSMQLVRDQAVAERAKYETLFASFQAILRTFAVPATPLITGVVDEEDSDYR
jgi:septal ring factor EnvC (AmiA/AmiB activator)